MPVHKVFKYLKGSNFLPDYAGIKVGTWTKHKMRGKNNQDQPIDFTDAEKQAIKDGLQKLAQDADKLID